MSKVEVAFLVAFSTALVWVQFPSLRVSVVRLTKSFFPGVVVAGMAYVLGLGLTEQDWLTVGTSVNNHFWNSLLALAAVGMTCYFFDESIACAIDYKYLTETTNDERINRAQDFFHDPKFSGFLKDFVSIRPVSYISKPELQKKMIANPDLYYEWSKSDRSLGSPMILTSGIHHNELKRFVIIPPDITGDLYRVYLDYKINLNETSVGYSNLAAISYERIPAFSSYLNDPEIVEKTLRKHIRNY